MCVCMCVCMDVHVYIYVSIPHIWCLYASASKYALCSMDKLLILQEYECLSRPVVNNCFCFVHVHTHTNTCTHTHTHTHTHTAASLQFAELDFSISEPMLTRSITVEKVDPNNFTINFNILLLTTAQFLSMTITLPQGLEDTPNLDPAERK